MKIIYNNILKGYQVVWTPNIRIKQEKWNKPVNEHIYETWDDAADYINRIESMN